MKQFKFLKRNTHYNEQIVVGMCGSTFNYITTFRGDDTVNTNNVMAELVNATRTLREEMNVLEQETRRLRDDLNRSLGQV